MKLLVANQLGQAVELLQRGELVVIPTETVYGLSADITNADAVRQIYRVKNRPLHNPLIVHIGAAKSLNLLAKDIPKYVAKITDKFWPGPLTLVLKKSNNVSDVVTGGQDTVAVRMPLQPLTQAILEHFPYGLAAPSANRYMQISPTSSQDALDTELANVAAILDGGACEVGIESTILDCTQTDQVSILRLGQIGLDAIQELLAPLPVLSISGAKIRVPGQDKRHYAPNKTLLLLSRAELQAKSAELKVQNVVYTGFGFAPLPEAENWQIMPKDHKLYAQMLYQVMRKHDKLPGAMILVERPPESAEWAYICDKLTRASA